LINLAYRISILTGSGNEDGTSEGSKIHFRFVIYFDGVLGNEDDAAEYYTPSFTLGSTYDVGSLNEFHIRLPRSQDIRCILIKHESNALDSWLFREIKVEWEGKSKTFYNFDDENALDTATDEIWHCGSLFRFQSSPSFPILTLTALKGAKADVKMAGPVEKT